MAIPLQILVTGANGYVGQAFTHLAIQAGHRVATLTRQEFPLADTKNHILDKYLLSDLEQVVKNQDVIVHLAAKAHQAIRNSPEVMASYYDVNVDNSIKLAKAALAAGVKKFIFVSSIKVNGERTYGRPFSSRDKPNPQDIYGQSKYQAELALTELLQGSSMQLIIVRPPLVWGGELKGNLKSLAQLIKWRVPIPVGAVKNRRSLLSLNNLCKFLLLCSCGNWGMVNIFLIADAEARTTGEIVRLIASQKAINAHIVSVPNWLWRCIRLLPAGNRLASKLCDDLEVDTSEVHHLTGWRPEA